MGETAMKVLGLVFGLGQFGCMNHPLITVVNISDGFDTIRIPLFIFGVIAFVAALATKVILYGV
jgi:hypothetical protein